MVIEIDTYEYLLNLRSDIKKKDFLIFFGAEKGFHKEVFSSIYDSIYTSLIDLEDEYLTFFSREYTDFKSFLLKKMNLNRAEADYVVKSNQEHSTIRFYRRPYGFFGNRSILDYLEDDDLEKKVHDLVSVDYGLKL